MATPTRTKALALQGEFQRGVAGIRSDTNLSAEGRQAAILPLYNATKVKIDALRAQEQTDATRRQATLEREIFGTIGSSDPGAVISYRDAQDRANALPAIGGEADAVRLLEQAQRSGDTQLAKAIAQRAFTVGWVNALNAFGEANPRTGEQIQELFDIHQDQGSRASQFDASMAFNVPKPPEIASINTYAATHG